MIEEWANKWKGKCGEGNGREGWGLPSVYGIDYEISLVGHD